MQYNEIAESRYEEYDRKYPRAGAMVDGRQVMDQIPNTSSISASLTDYEELPGIREVPMSEFGGEKSFFYAADDFRRSRELAQRITESDMIAPIIVVIDAEDHMFSKVRIVW